MPLDVGELLVVEVGARSLGTELCNHALALRLAQVRSGRHDGRNLAVGVRGRRGGRRVTAGLRRRARAARRVLERVQDTQNGIGVVLLQTVEVPRR